MSQGCPYPPPAATVGRAGLAPHVSSTIELTLLAEAWLSKEELSLLSVMWWRGWEQDALPSSVHQYLRQVGELALRSKEREC